jgi:hypothetical protein
MIVWLLVGIMVVVILPAGIVKRGNHVAARWPDRIS